MSKIGKSTETENSSSLGLLYWGMIVKGNRVLFCSKIDCGEVTRSVNGLKPLNCILPIDAL